MSIDISNYSQIKEIGKGAFSNVFLYELLESEKQSNKNKLIETYKEEYEKIVVKSINSKYFKYVDNEIRILNQINSYDNPYIIKYLGCRNITYNKSLFFEIGGINLYSFYKKIKYDSNDIINIGYQIFKGIEFIHSIDIIHTDLKPENILINKKTFEIKIIDFGSALEKENVKYNNFYLCTRYYRAPELAYNLYFNEKIDIWSIGCIIIELISGKPLYIPKNELELIEFTNDLLGTPTLIEYTASEKYKQLFLYNDKKLPIYNEPYCFDIKFDKYLIKRKFTKIQQKHLKDLYKSILTYNLFDRYSATECLNNPIFLQKQLHFIPSSQPEML